MFNRVLFIILSIAIMKNALYGDISLYLKPKVMVENGNVFLKDIVSIEGSFTDSEKIGNIRIEDRILSDGYIDKKEIILLLKNCIEDNLCIYGNAVRIINNEQLNNKYLNQIDECLVKKGDRVDVIVKKNGITLILGGIVLNEGKIDEEIPVRLENNSGAFPKLVKGKVKGKDLIEINL